MRRWTLARRCAAAITGSSRAPALQSNSSRIGSSLRNHFGSGVSSGKQNPPVDSYSGKEGVKSSAAGPNVPNTWQLDWTDEHSELSSGLLKFRHIGSGAIHYHLSSPDPHLLMGIAVRTEVFDKSGRDHLLQKLILAGSERFPVKDAFAHMGSRSLGESTSGGAWAGGEFTAYNFGSRNKQDFYNLLEVYLEAIFNPRLTKADFLEEGWRLEFSNPNDPATPLVLRGREVNEVRKSMVDLNQIAIESVYSELFLQNRADQKEFSLHSSEKLERLVSLDHAKLKEYHEAVYHPSNITFFSYGNLEISELLTHLDTAFLNKYTSRPKAAVEPAVPTEPLLLNAIQSGQGRSLASLSADSLQQRRQLVLRAPKSSETGLAGGSCVGLAFPCLLADKNTAEERTQAEEHACLSVLSTLLFELPSSPFFKDFLESGVAGGYIPGYGYEPNMSNNYFTVGLKGVREGTEDATIEMMRYTLSKVAKEGFNELEIESTLTQIELLSLGKALLPSSALAE